MLSKIYSEHSSSSITSASNSSLAGTKSYLEHIKDSLASLKNALSSYCDAIREDAFLLQEAAEAFESVSLHLHKGSFDFFVSRVGASRQNNGQFKHQRANFILNKFSLVSKKVSDHMKLLDEQLSQTALILEENVAYCEEFFVPTDIYLKNFLSKNEHQRKAAQLDQNAGFLEVNLVCLTERTGRR